ncbi:MAG: hypothetical protein QM704_05420 [Anaeromyxobacteraceae bacterium]
MKERRLPEVRRQRDPPEGRQREEQPGPAARPGEQERGREAQRERRGARRVQAGAQRHGAHPRHAAVHEPRVHELAHAAEHDPEAGHAAEERLVAGGVGEHALLDGPAAREEEREELGQEGEGREPGREEQAGAVPEELGKAAVPEDREGLRDGGVGLLDRAGRELRERVGADEVDDGHRHARGAGEERHEGEEPERPPRARRRIPPVEGEVPDEAHERVAREDVPVPQQEPVRGADEPERREPARQHGRCARPEPPRLQREPGAEQEGQERVRLPDEQEVGEREGARRGALGPGQVEDALVRPEQDRRVDRDHAEQREPAQGVERRQARRRRERRGRGGRCLREGLFAGAGVHRGAG